MLPLGWDVLWQLLRKLVCLHGDRMEEAKCLFWLYQATWGITSLRLWRFFFFFFGSKINVTQLKATALWIYDIEHNWYLNVLQDNYIFLIEHFCTSWTLIWGYLSTLDLPSMQLFYLLVSCLVNPGFPPSACLTGCSCHSQNPSYPNRCGSSSHSEDNWQMLTGNSKCILSTQKLFFPPHKNTWPYRDLSC